MNTTRILNLFRAYLIENKKMLLICCIISFGVQAFSFTVDAAPEISPLIPYAILFWVAGTFFQHSLKRNNSMHFFNLPVTVADKLAFAVIFLAIFIVVIHLLTIAGAYIGYYIIHPLLNTTFFSNRWEYYGRPTILEQLLHNLKHYLFYFAGYSVFLFGSIYFKKNAFWKTIVSGIGLTFAYAVYYIVLLYAIVLKFFAFDTETMYYVKHNNTEFTMNAVGYINIDISRFCWDNLYTISAIATIVFFFSLTYLRLRETEV